MAFTNGSGRRASRYRSLLSDKYDIFCAKLWEIYLIKAFKRNEANCAPATQGSKVPLQMCDTGYNLIKCVCMTVVFQYNMEIKYNIYTQQYIKQWKIYSK